MPSHQVLVQGEWTAYLHAPSATAPGTKLAVASQVQEHTHILPYSVPYHPQDTELWSTEHRMYL